MHEQRKSFALTAASIAAGVLTICCSVSLWSGPTAPQRGITAAAEVVSPREAVGPASPPVVPEANPTRKPTGAPAPPAPVLPPPEKIPVRPARVDAEPPPVPPVSLDIPNTSISVNIVEVGVDKNDAMEIPNSFWEAGWYRYGPAPGSESGNAVIAGHVDSQTEVLPFAQLRAVVPGTVITVGLADGRALRYEVTEVRNVPKATLNGSEVFRRDGPAQLKIITCGGKWLPEKGDYEDNVVLTALPL
ncbi:class F sortase [Arthrobacter crusticola]|uniref:class F sortase n=1 Tax=Arthrobacter crusticola TaxID=2547960 RepID=UPI001FE38414|nr:class F sortase [Arthrobacter crusticola]